MTEVSCSIWHIYSHLKASWEFEHTTTSPYHSQANRKVEAAVKIAKNITKKAKKSGHDIWKGILDWRNAPTEYAQYVALCNV